MILFFLNTFVVNSCYLCDITITVVISYDRTKNKVKCEDVAV